MSKNVKNIIENQLVEILLLEPTLFLVQVKIDAKNNIKVFLDGDKGISIGQCTQVNRSLYPFIEEQKLFPNDDFSLEVSSAGIDEPLLLERQYVKNIGRDLAIVLTDGIAFNGTLISIIDGTLKLTTTNGKGKKALVKEEMVQLNNIKTAIVQVKF